MYSTYVWDGGGGRTSVVENVEHNNSITLAQPTLNADAPKNCMHQYTHAHTPHIQVSKKGITAQFRRCT